MRHAILIVLLMLAALIGSGAAGAAQPAAFHFASPEHGRSVLGVRDEFVQRLSPFDRAARLKSGADVSEQQYLAFVGAQVLAWEDGASKMRVASALKSVTRRLDELGIALPKSILVVRTTGREEGGAAYTRGDAIVLPDTVLADPRQDLVKTISHETFHVLTRNSKALRTRAYKIIGFTPCPEFRFPAELANLRITNPDAPKNDHWIEVRYRGAPSRAIPILYAAAPRYDPARGGEFFDYLEFRLALIPMNAGPDSGARIVGVGEVQDFLEQVGRNTDYIIHPEEVLADNFALLFVKTPALPSPTIPAELLKVVQAEAPSK